MPKSTSTIQKIIQFPLFRTVIAILFFIPTIILFNILFKLRLESVESAYHSYYGDIVVIILFFIGLFLYKKYVNIVEKRKAIEIGKENSIKETSLGFLISASLVIITFIFILLIGDYSIINTSGVGFIIHALFIFGFLAFIEELLFRGVFFRLLEELLGSWISYIIIALLFGVAHLMTGEATLFSIFAIAAIDLIQTGAFILTRRLWLTWGIHWGWNFVQDGILGMPNSGIEFLPSFINPNISGSEWLTGGTTGIELSIIGISLNIIVGVIIISVAIKRNQIIKPIWHRNRIS